MRIRSLIVMTRRREAGLGRLNIQRVLRPIVIIKSKAGKPTMSHLNPCSPWSKDVGTRVTPAVPKVQRAGPRHSPAFQ